MVENSLFEEAQRALVELRALYDQARSGGKLDNWKVSAATNQLVPFQQRYAARLTANRAIGDEFELRAKLRDDLKRFLHALTALKDAVTATGATAREQVNLQAATDRYNARGAALEVLLTALRAPGKALDAEPAPESAAPLIAAFQSESEREIFQVVARITPAEQAVDEGITSLLYVLMKQAHREPSIERLSKEGKGMHFDGRALRQLANSQELRDVVGPYLAALIKKALSDEGVEAYDDAFRNTYFAVVNRVQNYYQTAKPSTPTQESRRTTQGAAADAPVLRTSNVVLRDEVKPLVTEEQAEVVTHENQVPVSKPKTVKGTGLE